MIRVYHACQHNGNVGDVMSAYIAKRIASRSVTVVDTLERPHYFVVGSILREANGNTTVLGAGFGDRGQSLHPQARVIFVRGPISAQMSRAPYICDPACVLPLLYNPRTTKQYNLGVIPHYVDLGKFQVKGEGIRVISPLQPVEDYINKILTCEAVVSSSLHGIITAHAYGIPALWVRFSDGLAGDGMKFEDYFRSVGIPPYAPLELREVSADLVHKIPSRTGKFGNLKRDVLKALQEHLV